VAGGRPVTALRAGTPGPAVTETGRYPVTFIIDTGFGRAVGVDLAAAVDANPATLIALLHPEERPMCDGMRGARLVEFAGGRIACRLARDGIPGADGPTLRGASGEPAAKGGVSVSISHARRYAVALAKAGTGCTVGIDIEPLDDDGAGVLLAGRILSEHERAADGAGEAIPALRRLSLKEAAYKALFPRLGHIPLRDILVTRRRAAYRITTPACDRPIAAASHDHDGHALSLVRVG